MTINITGRICEFLDIDRIIVLCENHVISFATVIVELPVLIELPNQVNNRDNELLWILMSLSNALKLKIDTRSLLIVTYILTPSLVSCFISVSP
jgi:hypothetical protein